MTKYRAILIDPENTTAERPLQIFGQDFATMQEWADKTILKAVGKHAHVDVFEEREQHVYRASKPKEENAKA